VSFLVIDVLHHTTNTLMIPAAKSLAAAILAAATTVTPAIANIDAAAEAINRFGLELHRKLASPDANLVISPWSIQSALGMTLAGAANETRDQMAAVLHAPDDHATLHAGLAALAADLDALANQSRKLIASPDRRGGPNTPLEIRAANRLFGQQGYPFVEDFLATARDIYQAPLEPIDFAAAPEPARIKINDWVATQTNQRIQDLIPPGLIDTDTRLVLTNAVYLLAPWADEFEIEENATFFVHGRAETKVQGLQRTGTYGHATIPGGQLVSIPYHGGGLRFLLLIPDQHDGLAALEASITHEALATPLEDRPIQLHLPKFKLEPPASRLAATLAAMGMPHAFDRPRGSADFSNMAPRTPQEYLLISEVVHRAFIAIDQYGTEAAAATAVVMMRATSAMPDPEPPLEIRADRPFAFAIQHVASGACLFLGRVSDPTDAGTPDH